MTKRIVGLSVMMGAVLGMAGAFTASAQSRYYGNDYSGNAYSYDNRLDNRVAEERHEYREALERGRYRQAAREREELRRAEIASQRYHHERWEREHREYRNWYR